jgi:RNA polymerase sigma-32 factor
MSRNEYPLLTADEERRIAREYRRTQDRRLEDRLVRSQMRLVGKLAHEHAGHLEDIADLIQEGALGLVLAVRRFDPERGVRLSTYASWWIRAYVLRWLVANHRLVRLGKSTAERHIFHKVRGLRARLESAGLDAGVDELARHLDEDPDLVRDTLLRLERPEISLDAPAANDAAARRIDRLADRREPPDEQIADAELAGLVMREADAFRRCLSGRDRTLFEARWFEAERPTLKALGTRFGSS